MLMGDFSENFIRPIGQKISEYKILHLREREVLNRTYYRVMGPEISLNFPAFSKGIHTVFAAEARMAWKLVHIHAEVTRSK